MKDPYDLRKAQDKKMTMEARLEEDLKRKANKIEVDNNKLAINARKKLEKAEKMQKRTTTNMSKQNEKLLLAKEETFKIHQEAEDAKARAIALEKEKDAFDPFSSFKTAFSTWSEKDTDGDKEIEKMKHNQKNFEYNEFDEYSGISEVISDDGKTIEAKTDEELKRILQSVRRINKETDVQTKVGEKEETNLQDIMKASEYAKKSIGEADDRLRKDL
ncbi:hypothetical protein GINT2_001274 [Glugoides intestinalis]